MKTLMTFLGLRADSRDQQRRMLRCDPFADPSITAMDSRMLADLPLSPPPTPARAVPRPDAKAISRPRRA